MLRLCALIPRMILFVVHRSDLKDTYTLINSLRTKERHVDVDGPIHPFRDRKVPARRVVLRLIKLQKSIRNALFYASQIEILRCLT